MDKHSSRHDRSMSKKQAVLLLTPPLFPAENSPEQEEFRGIPCSSCQGNGCFLGMEENSRDTIRKECPVCKGNKKLKAVVTINWLADESK